VTGLGTCLGVSIVIAVVAVTMYWVRFQLRLRSHHGMERANFVEYFTRRGVSSVVASAVYDHYCGVAVWSHFRISPHDELQQIFGHGPDETDASLDAILRKLRFAIPPPSVMQSPKQGPVTVADVVVLVDWIGSHQSAEL
jgi:hypothetical protein